MRFAIADQVRVTPSPGARGSCSFCGAELIAKCGPQKIWHWAHKRKADCDHWWENETEWHRNWKEQFPPDWSEQVQFSVDGEKHIADIKTDLGLVIEFQHSPISSRELWSREDFYQKMIWVVDGARLKSDSAAFFKHIKNKERKDINGTEIFIFNPLVPKITKRWMIAQAPVFLDFGDGDLWRISVQKGIWQKVASKTPKTAFIEALLSDKDPLAVVDEMHF